MKPYPTFKDVDVHDVYNDLNKLMYMLHHLQDEAFTKKEVCDVCFSVRVTLNSLEELIATGRKRLRDKC